MQSVLLALHIMYDFQMTGLHRRTFFFNEKVSNYVCNFLNEDLET